MRIPKVIKGIRIGTPEQFEQVRKSDFTYELKNAKIYVSESGIVYVAAPEEYVDFVLGRDIGAVLDA